MFIKRAYSASSNDDPRVEIVQPGERTKTAGIMPAVRRFIDSLEPSYDHTHALVSAMSYSEYFGPNSNTDWYGYNPHLDFNGLVHAWPEFGRDVGEDARRARDWPHGYPCFYTASVYAHHKNTDPTTLGFGDVIFVHANPHMKRIELVMRINNEQARLKGHHGFIDRLERGERVDVSMGAKIPFDACSVCTDWDRVREAMSRFDPTRHRHAMSPVLDEHRRRAIQGVAETRKQYCSCMRTQAGKINEDGQMVYVYNDAPRFFDISLVLIGADRTSRAMWVLPAKRRDSTPAKTSSLVSLGDIAPIAGQKTAMFTKHMPAVVEAMKSSLGAPDLSSRLPTGAPTKVLAALASLGIVASPKEFARVCGENSDFDPSTGGIDYSLSITPADIDDRLAASLSSAQRERSVFAGSRGPIHVSVRTIVVSPRMAAKYAAYRLGLLKHASEFLGRAGVGDLTKLGGYAPVLRLTTPSVVQWISSYLVQDLTPENVDTITKVSSMVHTTKDLEKVGYALDGIMRVSNTSSLWSAIEELAETMRYV